jgi:hypothetical protein
MRAAYDNRIRQAWRKSRNAAWMEPWSVARTHEAYSDTLASWDCYNRRIPDCRGGLIEELQSELHDAPASISVVGSFGGDLAEAGEIREVQLPGIAEHWMVEGVECFESELQTRFPAGGKALE